MLVDGLTVRFSVGYLRAMRAGARHTPPRLILALLLAFLVDTTRPVVQPGSHGHANGGRPHVHLGAVPSRTGGAASLLAAEASRAKDGRPGIARASASDLHVHLFRTLHVSHVAPAWPAPAIGSCPLALVVEPRGEGIAPVRRRPARGPPTLSA